jgi:glycine cleavage system H protein
MAGSPTDRRYSGQHFWAKIDGDKATIGVTKHNISSLGQIKAVTDLSAIGVTINQGDKVGTINRTNNSADDFVAPLGGQVTDREEHYLHMDGINSDPYADGSWFITITNFKKAEYDALMSASEYDTYTT